MKTNLLLSASAVALMALSSTAWAQEAAQNPQTPNQAEVKQVQPIVVTAERRAANIQSVPVSITPVTSKQLNERNIVNPRELVFLTPDMKINAGVSNTAEGFAIRGVGTTNFGGIPQDVPTVLDEVVVPSYVARHTLFDVNHIEILKGPQGTLFGADSSSGLINIVTQRPQLGKTPEEVHLSDSVADSETNFQTPVVQSVTNVPLGSTAALRVDAYYTHQGPMQKDVFDGRRLGRFTDWGVRGKFLWQPTDEFTAYLTAEYSKQDDPVRTPSIVRVVPGGYFAGLFAQYGLTPSIHNDNVFIDGLASGHWRETLLTGNLSWKLGEYTLTSISGYLHTSTIDADLDVDSGPLNLLTSTSTTPSNNTYSEEVKLISPADRPFSFVAGLLFTSSSGSPTHNSLFGKIVPVLVPLPLFFQLNYYIGLSPKTYAAYGQGTYSIANGWRLLAGARLSRETNTFTYSAVNAPGAIPFPGFPAITFKQSYRDDNFAWKLGIEHDLGPGSMLYATAARGYKGPGFSIVSVFAGENAFVKPEIPTSFELGLKSMLFDGALRLNGAIFKTSYKDFQAQVVDTSGAVARTLTANVGSLDTHGAEIEFQAVPVTGLSLYGGAAYVFAKYRHFINQPCYAGQTAAEGCINGKTDASGQNLADSPRWTFTTTAAYDFPVSGRLNGFATANYYWRSSANFSPVGDPLTRIGPYGILGGSVGVGDSDKGWKASLWVKNLLNKTVPGSIGHVLGATLYNAADATDLAYYNTADSYRQIGVSLDFAF